MDNRIGFQSAVVARAELAAKLPPRRDGLKIVPATAPAALDWLDRLGVSAVVLRPDRYIFGVAQTAPELQALLARYTVARRRRAAAVEQLSSE